MQGFFSRKETESVSASGGKIHSCASCGLYKFCSTPKMKPYGKFSKGIMVIGPSPDRTDDRKGKPFQGKAGRMLRRELSKHGIDLFEDCISLNAVNCHPSEEPSNIEIDHCRSVVVWKALKEYQPKMVLLLGNAALHSVVGYQWSSGVNINTWRGFRIPDQGLKTWVCPTFDPAYLDSIDTPKQYMTIWKQDIERALEMVEAPFLRTAKPNIHFVKDCTFIKDLRPVLSSFDYETTGVKPHGKGHRIACVSIADREDRVWVFPAPKKKADWLPFRKWLYDKRVRKMAHNLKFEDTWSKVILKVGVRGWEWDSMLAAHIIDNRTGITRLKFQIYINFGIRDYSVEIDPYLKSGDEKGANTHNRVMELMKTKTGREKLMEYCAYDSVYQYWLALKQMEELDYDFLPF